MMRISSIVSGLTLIAAPCILIFGLSTLSGMAADEERQELVPGLDMWSQERTAVPYRKPQESSQDLLPQAKRHREFMQAGVPLEYRSRESPYPAATIVIIEGGELYVQHCVRCHDSKGLGYGDAGRDLTPLPAVLAYMIKRPRSVDEYLLWTISEGGAQFGTEMPAFKQILTERQIWQIVIYMRAGFPDVTEAGQD